MNFIFSFFLLNWYIILTNSNIIRDGCGAGWDLPFTNLSTKEEYCYKFNYEKNLSLNWFEAVQICKLETGELFYPENSEEAAWVSKVIHDPQTDNSGVHFEDVDADGWFLNAHKSL